LLRKLTKGINFCSLLGGKKWLGGMYFESDYDIQPGADIYIKMNNYSADTSAKVTWCKEYSASDSSYYGVGVKYYENK